MKNVAIIPARGGSKRIPKKNIKVFCGQPLIAYSIQAALKSNCFDRVIVSTDDAEIAEVAKHWGAEVPFMRPAELADDYTGTTAVTRHAITALQQAGFEFDNACCIYATAPFLQPAFLNQGLQALQKQPDKSYAFSVTSYAFPIQRSIAITDAGVSIMYPEHIGKRSQDLEEAYHDAGQFYWGRTADFVAGKKRIFSQHSQPIILPRHLVQDIDTPEDWQRAELMYTAYMQNK